MTARHGSLGWCFRAASPLVRFLKRYLKNIPSWKHLYWDLRRTRFDSCWAISSISLEEMRSGAGDASPIQFIAVRLPYRYRQMKKDAQKASTFIQPDVSLVVNIKVSWCHGTRCRSNETNISDFSKGNIETQSHDCSVCFVQQVRGVEPLLGPGPCSGNITVSSQNLEMVVRIFYFSVWISAKENNCLKPWGLILLSNRENPNCRFGRRKTRNSRRSSARCHL